MELKDYITIQKLGGTWEKMDSQTPQNYLLCH